MSVTLNIQNFVPILLACNSQRQEYGEPSIEVFRPQVLCSTWIAAGLPVHRVLQKHPIETSEASIAVGGSKACCLRAGQACEVCCDKGAASCEGGPAAEPAEWL